MARERRVARVGEVYAARLPGGKYAAMQVLPTTVKDRIELATLDGMFDTIPTAKDVAKKKVLRRGFGAWGGAADRVLVETDVPWWAIHVATIAPVETFTKECGSYGGWHGQAPFLQWRWKEMRQGERAGYIAGVDRREVMVDLGAGPKAMRVDTWRLWLGEKSGLLPLPAKGRIDWSGLDALPSLTEISYRGSDPGFIDFVRSRRLLGTVRWFSHGRQTIDLRDTMIGDLSVDAAKDALRVVLPRWATSLTLRGNAGKVTVVADDVRYPFRVRLEGPELPAKTISGLEQIEALSAWSMKKIDVKRLAPYARLAALSLRGAPGSLVNAAALAKLANLRELEIHELYDLDAASFPEAAAKLPLLERADVHGLRKEMVPVLKKKLAGVPGVKISGAKTESWIEANLSNPFRGWEEEEPAMGRAACTAWRKAAAAAEKSGRATSAKSAEKILCALVDALNRIDERHSFDTIRREESFEAFMDLAARFDNVKDKDAAKWFDARRNF